jgi:signal transduction histidine kinase
VRLAFRNGGVIPPELISRLFEPFRRGQPAGPGRDGLGLGLYIVKQIALAHGGRVDVRSSEAEGTVVEVVLPRTSASGAGAA